MREVEGKLRRKQQTCQHIRRHRARVWWQLGGAGDGPGPGGSRG